LFFIAKKAGVETGFFKPLSDKFKLVFKKIPNLLASTSNEFDV